jgi:Leucine-rich repeat (LRR) protein
MHVVSCKSFLLSAIIIVANSLIAHASTSRHCDDLQRDNITCPALCDCCLRNSNYDDTSLVIRCNQSEQHEFNFTSDLTQMLHSVKAADIGLKLFDLQGARLTSIPDEMCSITSLEELHLTKVHLNNVSSSCIQQLTQLRILDLALNEITSLPNDLLYGLTELEELRLNNNQIVDVQPEVFSFATNMTKLQQININDNKLTSLDIWPLFLKYGKPFVDVSRNSVSTFTNRRHYRFKCEPYQHLPEIILRSNKVEHLMDIVNGYELKGVRDPNLFCLFFGQAIRMDLYDNSLICDCVDYQLYTLMKSTFKSVTVDNMYCAQPLALQDRKLVKVMEHMDQFVCEIQDNCPQQCRCFNQPYTNSIVVQCDNRGISDIATNLPSLPRYRSYNVSYSHNSIATVPFRQYYSQSKVIRLDNNHIQSQSLDADVLASMVNVTELHLHNNLLTSLPRQVADFNWTNLQAIHLYGNLWSCDCNSQWMKDWFKTLGKIVVNLNAITCSTDDIRNGRSLIDVRNEDFVCGHIMSTNEIIWVVVTIVTASVFSVVVATLVTLYKKRMWLYKRFQLHPFDVDECEGEDMTHDVFLSGADKDTDDIKKLRSQLTELGYRVLCHKIDFVPGPVIDSIEIAITHSKRTVCFVTPSFIQCVLCMWQFNDALSRDLSNKRHRLIVIVDDKQMNIDTITDSSVKQYLRTHTHIPLHSIDFINDLKYSLPQRKLGQRQEESIMAPGGGQDDADAPLIDVS